MSGKVIMTAVAIAVLSSSGAMAQNNAPIYGSQLMTQQERMEYRNQMRAMKTQEERNAFRLEHHTRMQERARERGLTLPDSPPAGGGGMGPGPGGGMGGGRGRGAP
jgi:hypothetical protein